MRLGEVMTRDVETIDSNSPLKQAAAKMKSLDIGLIPVCDGDKLKGTLTDRDITVRATAEGRHPTKTKVGDIMSTDIVYCFEDQEIEEAMSLMEARQIRRLPILSREKRLVGIVSSVTWQCMLDKMSSSVERLRKYSRPAVPRRMLHEGFRWVSSAYN